MDKTTIIVCAVVGSLGVLSAILGFSAEGTKLTPYTILVYGDDCIYPQNPALGLGVCAIIFLLVAQVTISAVGGCCGCCKSRSIPSETKRVIGIVCAVISWIAAAVAWVLLIEGAAWNANVVRESAPYCPYLKDGIFAGAGVLALAATALGITSVIMLRRPPQPVEAAAMLTASVSGTPSRPAGGEPPSKPQPYVQQVSPQGNGQAPQNLLLEAPPLPPADQGNGSQPANQQLPPPPQGLPTGAEQAAAACPPQEPGEQPPRPLVVAMGGQYALAPNDSPQAVCAEIPVSPLTPGPSQGNGLSTVIRNELARATIRFAEKAVEHTVFNN